MGKVYTTDDGLPAVEEAGELRSLAVLDPREACGLAPLGAAVPVLPPEKWEETSLGHFRTPAKDQGRSNACTGFAVWKAFLRAWLVSGQRPEDWNPYSIYAQINGGRDRGATMEDAAAAIVRGGIARISDLPERVMYPGDLLPSVAKAMKRWRALEAYYVSSWPELMTALTLGFVCIGGIRVGTNLGVLDAEGVSPLPDVEAGGHALEFHGLKYSRRRGEWLVETGNSWGPRWGFTDRFGNPGNCRLTERHFGRRYDVFALWGVRDDPGETTADFPTTR